MSKWTIVAYPDEDDYCAGKKSKIIEAENYDEAIDRAGREFLEYHEVGAYENK